MTKTVDISIPPGEAAILLELLDRYYEGQTPEFVADRAEWRALVLLAGHLERAGASELDDYESVVSDARRELAAYDGIPF